MPRTALRLLVAVLCALLLVTSTNGVAEARKKKRGGTNVVGISRVSQDWPGARLKVRWRAVRSASYQMRAATSTSGLSAAPLISSGTSGGTWTGRLDRSRAAVVQVRAVRAGVVGAWSKPRALSFQNAWPKKPTSFTAGSGAAEGQVRFAWSYTPYVSHYRPVPDAAWFGNWPTTAPGAPGWLSETARSATWQVPRRPGAGDQLLAVDYGNPVYARLEATNRFHPQKPVTSSVTWKPAFPRPATPAPGAPVRMGTWNVGGVASAGDARSRALAGNISTQGVEVVALQEANAATADAIRSALVSSGGRWTRAQTSRDNVAQQVLYRSDRFTSLGTGAIGIDTNGMRLEVPWVKLRPASGGPSFYAGSVHLSGTDPRDSAGRLRQNADTGRSAQQILAGIARLDTSAPFLLAGDLRYGREPFTENPAYLPAQPTLVRGGFYDAQAAVRRENVQFSTFNQRSASQPAHPSGVASRSDHILVKGFRGAVRYKNVANWSAGGLVPSDHNLVVADLLVPTS